LNTLRKEAFVRVHQQRKGDALRCSDRLREKPSKILVECKECAKETVSSYCKLKRKGEKFPGGHEEGQREAVNLEGFQAKKSHKSVCAELWKECKRGSRIT
jgi:hypothetical protein